MGEITSHLKDLKREFASDPKFRQRGGSFIQASKNKKFVEKSFKKQKQEHESKSKILAKPIAQKLSLANSSFKKSNLAPIP